MADHSRIETLRRRVEQEPASIAFAQLGEEYRRAGSYQEAVDVCRAGLALHPAYASARVTLGRALIELGQLDEAQTELSRALDIAPENLAAMRGLALVHERRGELPQALAGYRAALGLAPDYLDLERIVARLTRELQEQPAPGPGAASPSTEPPAPDPAQPRVAAAAESRIDGTVMPGAVDDRGRRTLAALEQWLAAIHVVRAHRRA